MIDDVTAKLQNLNTAQAAQSRKQEELEFHSRKLNLIFEGVEVREGESCKRVIEHIIHRCMRLDMPPAVDVAHTIGPYITGKSPAIIVRFRSMTDKSRILENSKILKQYGIFVRPDIPLQMAERRSYLAKSLPAARKQDPSARLVRDRLRYLDKLYTTDTIHEANIGDEKHTVYTNSQVRFYGYRSAFSNFYKSPFMFNGTKYICVEQALQSHRAYRNNDKPAWQRIMASTNPVHMKREGKRYAPKTEREATIEKQIVHDAVYQKFTQNDELRQKLLNTGNDKILECNPYDTTYSTGLRIDDERLNSLDYEGSNYMGVVLELVRDKLGQRK